MRTPRSDQKLVARLDTRPTGIQFEILGRNKDDRFTDEELAGVANHPEIAIAHLANQLRMTRIPPFVAIRELSLSDLPKLTSLAGIEALVSLQHIELDDVLARDPDTYVRLAELPELVELVLETKTLPSAIARLRSVITLTLVNAHHLDLDAAFVTLSKLPALRILKLRSFDGDMPETLGRLTALEQLECTRGCTVRSLPPSIGRLHALKVLHVRHKQMKKLPDELFACNALEELVLEGNQLPLSPKIGRLTALRTLDLQQTPLKEVPAELAQLTNLRVLRLPTKLASIPSELYALELDEYIGPHDRFVLRAPITPEDSSVDLRDGDRIPADLGHPRELRIRFHHTNTALPQLARCTELRTLRATCDLDLVVPYIPPSVTTLHLSSRGSNLESPLPPLPALVTLKIETKAFGDLVIEAPNLTSLIASGRGTLTVATKRLTELDLTRCEVPNLLGALAGWPLTRLALQESRIDVEALCVALAGKSLDSLALIDMDLRRLPAAIGTLAIKALNLFGNPLTSVPAEVGQIRGLERLVLPAVAFDKRVLPGRWKATKRVSIVIFERSA